MYRFNEVSNDFYSRDCIIMLNYNYKINIFINKYLKWLNYDSNIPFRGDFLVKCSNIITKTAHYCCKSYER